MCSVAQLSPLSSGCPSGLTWISNIELIASVVPPISGHHMLVLLLYHPVYNCHMIPNLHVSLVPTRILIEVTQLVAQSITNLLGLTDCNSGSWSHAIFKTRSISSLLTVVKWLIYWTFSVVSWCSIMFRITWSWRLWVVMCAPQWGYPRLLSSCTAMKMHVVLQWM